MATLIGTADDDYLTGSTLDDVIDGGAGDDVLIGGLRNDALTGGFGNDTLIGGAGNDTLTGGTGNDRYVIDGRDFGIDTINDLATNERIDLSALGAANLASLTPFLVQVGADVHLTLGFGGAIERVVIANRTLASLNDESFVFDCTTTSKIVNGTTLNDVLLGGRGWDSLFGGLRNDVLSAGDGNDQLDGGSGDDQLTGGAGSDRFIFSGREFGSDVVLDFAAGDRIDLRGLGVSDFTMLLPYLQQVGGDVRFAARFSGTAETILIKDADLASLSAANFVFAADLEGRNVSGGTLEDVLFGGRGGDTLAGGLRNDELRGGSGADRLIGGSGDDVLFGGINGDRFVYEGREFGNDRIADFGEADRIDLRGIGIGEFSLLAPYMTQVGDDVRIAFVYGGTAETIIVEDASLATLTANRFVFDDETAGRIVTGTTLDDLLFGTRGADRLVGGLRDDTLLGGSGNDTLSGGSGNDRLTGGAGDDRFLIDAREFGQDVIVDLGAGDTIDLSALNVATLAELLPFMATVGNDVRIALGFGGSAETITIANRTLSSLTSTDFVFNTSALPLYVAGSTLADVLFGGDGNDRLVGGLRADVMTGGEGKDLFVFAGASDFGGTTAATADVIRDFDQTEQDRIDLRGVDASSTASGDQAFTFLGTGAFTGVAGQLRYATVSGDTHLSGDLTGDGTADFLVVLKGGVALASGDFIL